MSGKKGFTLIELLVVIAIIAILAAILFPVFAQAKAAGQLSKCLNNAKQIVQGCILYEVDSGGAMLQGFKTGNWGEWYESITPYMRQMEVNSSGGYQLRGVWICPSMVRSNMKSNGSEIPADYKRCYGYNTYYLGGDLIPGSNPPKYDCHQSGEVVKSTKTIRVLETWGYHHYDLATKGWGTAYCYPPVKEPTNCVPSRCWPPGWHNGKSVVGWVDGHVSTTKVAPPFSPVATAYTGVMQKYYNNDGANGDPYFRLTYPKP